MNYRLRVGFYVLLALVGYLLPWVMGNGTALSMNAYDLSEWTSLHPLSREAAIPLLTSAMLRVPLALIAIFLVSHAPHFKVFSWSWWLLAGSFFVYVLATLPPLEWLTNAPRDHNYLQQAIIAAGLTVSGLIMMSNVLGKTLTAVIPIFALSLALITAWIGYHQSIGLFQELGLTMMTGSGLIVFSVATAIAMLDAYGRAKRVNRAWPTLY